MKIYFVDSLFNIPMDKWPEHLGMTARVIGSNKQRTLMMILPCGHSAMIERWNVTDIDTPTPSATPSIFCQGNLTPDGKPGACWHGYLTKGELISV